MERYRTGGNYLTEDATRGRRLGEVKRRSHRLNLRIDEDLYRAVRTEAVASGLSVSAVMRLALAAGVERVAGDRVTREVQS